MPGSRAVASGSSPLTRGKPHAVSRGRHARGLIPAHAGKTRPMSWKQTSSGAHPRSRGENDIRSRLHRGIPGSSPLTRGKHGAERSDSRLSGLIPAHAGKTASCTARCRTCKAHPRSRGENNLKMLETDFGAGSSPLTRGKRLCVAARRLGARLIPAHAGKTTALDVDHHPHAAHPRSRGENTRYWWVTSRRGGSSPLTRGKQRIRPAGRCDAGLIPAHAGKTAYLTTVCDTIRAHPRSRGENRPPPGVSSP